jgi:hypothetical protein
MEHARVLCNLAQGKKGTNMYKKEKVVSVHAMKAYISLGEGSYCSTEVSGHLHTGRFGSYKNP